VSELVGECQYVLNTSYDNVAGVFTTIDTAAQYLVRHRGWAWGETLDCCGVHIKRFSLDVGMEDRDEPPYLDLGEQLQAAFDALLTEPH
jgi:hypothetical protein